MNALSRRRKWLAHRWNVAAVVTILATCIMALWAAQEVLGAR